jgi:hypothetical protein
MKLLSGLLGVSMRTFIAVPARRLGRRRAAQQ